MFVSRNPDGSILGAFLNAQPESAEEFLQPDDPELVAFFESLNHSSKG